MWTLVANRDKLKLPKLRPLSLPIGWASISHNSKTQYPIIMKLGLWTQMANRPPLVYIVFQAKVFVSNLHRPSTVST